MYYIGRNNLNVILKGVKIDFPNIFLPWTLTANELDSFSNDFNIMQITSNYYVMKNVMLFRNLQCNIGLHFNKTLNKIELFRDSYDDLKSSYNDFQQNLVEVFGKPTNTFRGDGGFENYEWSIKRKIVVHHSVIDRFGLTEYAYISKEG